MIQITTQPIMNEKLNSTNETKASAYPNNWIPKDIGVVQYTNGIILCVAMAVFILVIIVSHKAATSKWCLGSIIAVAVLAFLIYIQFLIEVSSP